MNTQNTFLDRVTKKPNINCNKLELKCMEVGSWQIGRAVSAALRCAALPDVTHSGLSEVVMLVVT
jgi:hypothetical protein